MKNAVAVIDTRVAAPRLNENPLGIDMSRVGAIPIGNKDRRITESEKRAIMVSISEALHSMAGVVKTSIAIKIKQIEKEYLTSVGFDAEKKLQEASLNSVNQAAEIMNKEIQAEQKKHDERIKAIQKKHEAANLAYTKALQASNERWDNYVSKNGIVWRQNRIYKSEKNKLGRDIMVIEFDHIKPNSESTPESIQVNQAINDLRNSESSMSFHKLNMRISLATTVGEVAEICRAALGNHVLPDVV